MRWSCSELDEVWSDSTLWGFCGVTQFGTFKKLAIWIFRKQVSPDLFAIIVWSIWTQKEPNKTSSKVSNERLGEFHAVQPIPKTRVSQPRLRWKPPPKNLAKIDFDGAIFPEAISLELAWWFGIAKAWC